MNLLYFVLFYFIIMNLCGFLLMGVDKRRAKKHCYRISEKTLLSIALLGGSAGSIMGMYCFHHKTRHPRFKIGMPVIFLVQIAVIIFFTII